MPNNRSLILAIAAISLAGSCLAGNQTAKRGAKNQPCEESQLCSDAIQTVIESRETIMPLGIVVANIHDFDREEAAVLRAERKMNDRLQIVAVSKDSVAEAIGLQVGDIIMELNGIYVPKGEEAADQLVSRVLPQIDWSKPLRATILREGYAQLVEGSAHAAFAATEDAKREVAQ